jgi:glutaredoxin
MNRLGSFLALLLFMAVHAFANIYSWTDKNGVKHYSDEPPPKSEQVTDIRSVKESREDASSDAVKEGADRETSANAAGRKVVIYVDPQSDYCLEALSFFDQNNIGYTKYDITASEDELQRFKNVQGQGTPLIFIGDQRIDGWNESVVRRYLGMKSEPTTAEKAQGALTPAKRNDGNSQAP